MNVTVLGYFIVYAAYIFLYFIFLKIKLQISIVELLKNNFKDPIRFLRLFINILVCGVIRQKDSVGNFKL
jgi:hypothetical protein